MPNKILKGTGTKEKNSTGPFKENDNVPSWWKGPDITDSQGRPAEVVVTGSMGTISGKKAGDFVKGPTRASDPSRPVELSAGESLSFSGRNRSTGNQRTTTYTPIENTTRTRTPGRSFADKDNYYTTSTPVRITQTELKPIKKK